VLAAVAGAGLLTQLLPVCSRAGRRRLGAAYGVHRLRRRCELPGLAMATHRTAYGAGFGLLYATVLLRQHGCHCWRTRAVCVALLSGLTDVDAITLSSLRLHNLDKLSVTVAVNVHRARVLAQPGLQIGADVTIGGWQMARHAVAAWCAGAGAGVGLVYNARLFRLIITPIMEAESLNQYESKLPT